MWELVRFVIEKLDKEDWYSRIIILESIGSLKMSIKDCENLWNLWMIKIFVIEKLGEREYSWIIKIIIILESIGSLKMNKDCENLWRFVIEIFVIEKLSKGEYWYSWMIKIIITLESIEDY